MKDINLEIVHEINVRAWKKRFARLTPRFLIGRSVQYLVIPGLLAWCLM